MTNTNTKTKFFHQGQTNLMNSFPPAKGYEVVWAPPQEQKTRRPRVTSFLKELSLN